MRIISGAAKGKKLIPPPANSLEIRPTADKTRSALFNIIGPQIQGARVLDLFAGTGAVGVEAMSRGAKNVCFVDNGNLALTLLKQNIVHCLRGTDIHCEISVLSHDLTRSLPERELLNESPNGFDLVFADPPYSHEIIPGLLEKLCAGQLLAKGALVIVEERRNVALDTTYTVKSRTLELLDHRTYGEAGMWFFRLDSV